MRSITCVFNTTKRDDKIDSDAEESLNPRSNKNNNVNSWVGFFQKIQEMNKLNQNKFNKNWTISNFIQI